MSERANDEDGRIAFDARVVFGPRVLRTFFVAAVAITSVFEAIIGPSTPAGIRLGVPRFARGLGRPPAAASFTDAHGAFALRLLESPPDARRRYAELGGVRATMWTRALGPVPVQREHYFELVPGGPPSLAHRPSAIWDRYPQRFRLENPTANSVAEISLVVVFDGVSFAQRCTQLLVSRPGETVLPREASGFGETGSLCHRPRVPDSVVPGRGESSIYIHRIRFSDGTELVAE